MNPARRAFLIWPADSTRQKLLINLMALAIICVVLSIVADRFLTFGNATNVLRQISAIVICGAAVTMLMVAGGLDLSVGAVAALSGVSAALLSSVLPIPLAFMIAVLVGAFVGLVNAVLVVGMGINSVIATLGTLYVARGTALLITDGVPVYQVPDGYSYLGAGFLFGIPVPIWLMLGVLILFIALERLTVLGRYAVATGSNETAAKLSGVPTERTKAILFVLSGAAAGLAGVVVSSRLNSGLSTAGVGFEFEVIVATVLGGTSLLGGAGTVIGMAVGALIVGVVNNGMNLLGIPSFWQTVALGTVLVLAVAFDSLLRRNEAASRSRAAARPPVAAPAGEGRPL
jgi:ribose/xylose/arabinose/galactoside ABC-type transport system permease subunit